jgi:peptidoglycan/xylan/chitin deacetylase (PgdA/CDA1 family)
MLKHTIINWLDYCGGLKLARFMTRKKPMLLMYHRVLNDPITPGIDPRVFDVQMAYLKKHFNVLNLRQFYQGLSANNLPDNTIVITFDDGHHDFYTNAWPIIKKYNLTATLFVTTGFVDKQCWLWPDLLRYILLNTQKSQVDVANLGVFSLDKDRALKTWNSLGDYCLTLATDTRIAFIYALAKQLEVSVSGEPQHPFTPVDWQQLRDMQAQGLDVGSHSVTHPILSQVTLENLDWELATSKQRIEQELQSTPQGVCYPNGMAKDISTQVTNCSAAHYRYGVVAFPAPISIQDPMTMGRYGAPGNMQDFMVTVSRLTRKNNLSGEYL